MSQLPRRAFSVLLLSILLGSFSPALCKEKKTVSSSIDINAPPEVVFEAIRKQRNSVEQHRTLVSFDGKVAVIREDMKNVPIYGKVQCTWQETEQPYSRIDYVLLKSTKFKEGFGSWILKPSADNKKTNLTFECYTDTGLMIPFGAEITRAESAKSSKLRLEHIKDVSESSTGKPAEK